MNVLKKILHGSTIFTLLSLPLSSIAEDDVSYKAIPISVNNNTQISLYNARMKLNQDGDWVNIGNIQPGQNHFTVNGFLDDKSNIFEAQLENGQWLIGDYQKNNLNEIHLNIARSQDIKFRENLRANYQIYIPALSLYSVNTHEINLNPISTQLADVVQSTTCYSEDYGFYCVINYKPAIAYYGEGSTLSQNTMDGYFASNLTREQLLDKYSTKGSTSYSFLLKLINLSPLEAGAFQMSQYVGNGSGKGQFGN